MSENSKNKYKELLKKIQEAQERKKMSLKFHEEFRELGNLEGLYQSRFFEMESKGLRKYKKVSKKRSKNMVKYFFPNSVTRFSKQFEHHFNQIVFQDLFSWKPQWEKTKSVILSLWVYTALKQGFENWIDELKTFSSKILKKYYHFWEVQELLLKPVSWLINI